MNKIYNKIYIARTPTIGPFKQSFIAAIQPEDSSRSTTTIIQGLASKQKKDRLPNLFFHKIKRSTTLFSITH
jgi:hypothetical protein